MEFTVLFAICTVAMAVKVMCKYLDRDMKYNLNPRFKSYFYDMNMY